MKKKKQTLLWRIAHPAYPSPSYVFGTMHIRDQRAFGRLGTVYEKIGECEAFATEFDLQTLDPVATAAVMRLPDGKSLDQLMTARQYAKLKKILTKTAGLNLDLFRFQLPMIIANILDERILSKDALVSLDEHLWQYARNQGKALCGIETYAEQLEIMRKIPLEYQVKALIHLGKNISLHRKHLLKLVDLYETYDPARIFHSSKKSAGELRKLLLYDRNRIMADRIAEMAAEQAVFCAIGAAHLGGKKGVLRVLKRNGVEVKPESMSLRPG